MTVSLGQFEPSHRDYLKAISTAIGTTASPEVVNFFLMEVIFKTIVALLGFRALAQP